MPFILKKTTTHTYTKPKEPMKIKQYKVKRRYNTKWKEDTIQSEKKIQTKRSTVPPLFFCIMEIINLHDPKRNIKLFGSHNKMLGFIKIIT